MVNVFLSSTARDLSESRDAAYKAIEGLQGYHCVRMEDFGSWNAAPDDFCRSKVAECDIFICLAGPLYGSLTPAGPSFTEREFEASVENGLPYLAFLTEDEFLLPANLFEPAALRKRQMAFRKRIGSERVAARFSGGKDVAVKVVQALRNWEASLAPKGSPAQAKLLNSQIRNVSYRVAVFNQSTSATDAEVEAVVAALQTQVHRDFAPAWGVDADLQFIRAGSKGPASSWWLVIMDDSDQPGALGYRDLTADGLPMARVFVRSALNVSASWTVSASHILLEMLANPRQNLSVFVQSAERKGTLYPQEVCNPCSSEEFAYRIGKHLVSDFVFPAWFENFRKGENARFDFGEHIAGPFEILNGGYAAMWDVNSPCGWRFVFGSQTSKRETVKKRRRPGEAMGV